MAKSKKTGLGKGIDALIPKRIVEEQFDPTIRISNKPGVQITDASISRIWPNPDQPRRVFKREDLDDLAASIKEHGILQPLIVTPSKEGHYQIIAGERRWRAAKLANVTTLPVIVRSDDEQNRLEVALVENIQRQDLNPIEMATALQKLKDQFNMSYDQIAARVGKAMSTVSNMVRLLDLPDGAKQALMNNAITEGHARQILALSNTEQQEELLALIVRHGWSVRKTEQYVLGLKKSAGSKKTALRSIRTTTPETKKLSAVLKTDVSVYNTARGGRLQISFKSEQDLSRIIKKLLN